LLARDRRRARLLTCFTVFLWLLAFLAGVWVLLIYQDVAGPEYSKVLGESAKAGTHVDRVQSAYFQLLHIAGIGSLILLALVFLAGFSTFLLLFASRQVTLRQISLDLRDLSERLVQLQRARDESTGRAAGP
jgi:hypothetical protein